MHRSTPIVAGNANRGVVLGNTRLANIPHCMLQDTSDWGEASDFELVLEELKDRCTHAFITNNNRSTMHLRLPNNAILCHWTVRRTSNQNTKHVLERRAVLTGIGDMHVKNSTRSNARSSPSRRMLRRTTEYYGCHEAGVAMTFIARSFSFPMSQQHNSYESTRLRDADRQQKVETLTLRSEKRRMSRTCRA